MKHISALGMSVVAISLVAGLGGCGKQEEPKASQVAARVNGDEITVHQINFELMKMGGLNAENSKQAANQALKGLVDQQVLVGQAMENKLDRDPEVMQTLEHNRRQVLANAYLERLGQNTAKPTEAEIKDYYAKHPELFADRHIYKLQELAIQVTPENMDGIKAKLAEAKNLNDFVQWTKSQGIATRGNQSVKTAEQLPMELLPKLNAMKNGEVLTVNGKNMLTLLVMADKQAQPVSEEQAKPAIERFLLNSRKRELATAELKKLREKAKIEYVGDYVEAGKDQAQLGNTAQAPATPSVPAVDVNASAGNMPGGK